MEDNECYKITLQKLKKGIDINERPLTEEDWTEGEGWFVNLSDKVDLTDSYKELINVVKTLLKRF